MLDNELNLYQILAEIFKDPKRIIREDSTGFYVGNKLVTGDITYDDAVNGKRFATKIKHYGNGYMKVYTSNNDTFGVSIPKKAQKNTCAASSVSDDVLLDIENSEQNGSSDPERDRQKDVIRRAAEMIHDLILLNEDLEYFFSLTIDPKKFDSRDPAVVSEKVRNWLNNQVKRIDLKYLMVPEYHPEMKDHKIHFHGMINDVFNLVDSGTRTVKGFDKPVKIENFGKLHIKESDVKSIVYNVPKWRHGWTTAIPVYGTRLAIARYITKYITKADNSDNKKIFGSYYWSSRSCIREPQTEYIDDGGIIFNGLDVPAYNCCGNMYIKYLNLGGDLLDSDLDAFLEMNPCFSDRLSVKNFIKRSAFLKSEDEDKIEIRKKTIADFDRWLAERNARVFEEEKKKRDIAALQAAERRARREWLARQIKI